MSWTYQEAAEALGDIGQTVAGNIIAYTGVHVLVGSTSESGVFSLTPEGLEMLEKIKAGKIQAVVKAAAVEAPAVEAPAVEPKFRTGKKPKPESAKVEVPPEDDLSALDLNLE